MMNRKAPKSAQLLRALLAFALLLPSVAVQPSFVLAAKSQEKDFCDQVEIKNGPGGMPKTMYRRRNQGWNRVDEGNPRIQLFADALCTKVTSHHLFIPKRHWPNHPTPPPPNKNKQWLAYAPAAGKVQEIPFGKDGLGWDFKDGQEVNYIAFTKDMVPAPGEGERVITDPHPGGGTGPVEGGKIDVDPNDPLGAIIKLLHGKPVRYNLVADLIAKFLWDEGHKFVKTDGDPPPTKDAALGTIRTWVVRVMSGSKDGISAEEEEAIKSLGLTVVQPKFVAALFYVLAPANQGGLPGWITEPKEIKPDKREAFKKLFVGEAAKTVSDKRKQMLVGCLGRYTDGKENVGGCIARTGAPGPLVKNEPKWVYEWTIDAGAHAEAIITGNGIDADQIRREIGEHDREVPGGDLPGRKPPGLPDWGTGTAYNANFLYGKWGDMNVFGVPSKDGKTMRYIAVHLIEERVWGRKPPSASRLTFSDITPPPHNVYGQTIDIKNSGTAELMLDPDGDGFTYKVTFKTTGNGDIGLEIERTDAEVKIDFGGNKRLPTIHELALYRAKRTRQAGNIVEIGGQEFYVGGEGSYLGGAYTYYPKEMLDDIDGFLKGRPPWYLIPDHVAYVNKKPGLNQRELLTSGDDLTVGQIGGKWYGNKWNGDLGRYEIVEVAKPKPPAPKSPPGGTTGTGITTTQSTGFSAFDGYSATHESVAHINNALGENAKMKLLARTAATGLLDKRFILAFRGEGGIHPQFKGGGEGFKGFSFVAGTHIVKAEDNAGILYINMDGTKANYTVGHLLATPKTATTADLRVLKDILGVYYSKEDAAEIEAVVKEKKTEYGTISEINVAAKKEKDQIQIHLTKDGGKIVEGWPNDFHARGGDPDVAGDKGAVVNENHRETASGTGQTKAYGDSLPAKRSVTRAGINDGKSFEAARVIVGGDESKPKAAQAVIYSFEEKDDKDALQHTYYLLFFNIEGKDGKSEEKGQPPVVVFRNSVNKPSGEVDWPSFPLKADRNPDRAKVRLAPVKIADAEITKIKWQLGVARIERADLSEKGAWCFLQTEPKVKDKELLKKAVIYWGAAQAKADEACKALK